MRILMATLDERTVATAANMLRGQLFVIDHASGHDDALHLAREYSFDAVVVSAGANTKAGVDFIRRLRGTGSELPALAVTSMMDARGRTQMLDTGADDVMASPCDAEEMAARIRAVVRRGRGFARSVLQVGPITLCLESRTAEAHGRQLALSPSEYRVLELLLLRKGSAVTRGALMDLLYGDIDEPDVKSLNVLLHRLRKRLASAGVDGFIKTVWGAGYMVDERTIASSEPTPPLATRIPLSPFAMAG